MVSDTSSMTFSKEGVIGGSVFVFITLLIWGMGCSWVVFRTEDSLQELVQTLDSSPTLLSASMQICAMRAS